MNATTTASARLHLDTALTLVGRDQIMAWLSVDTLSGVAPTISSTTIRRTVAATVATTTAAGQRGRKAGTLPPTDQRCSWVLTSGDQCSNKKKEGSFCGLHIGKIQLIDPTASVSGSGGSDDE